MNDTEFDVDPHAGPRLAEPGQDPKPIAPELAAAAVSMGWTPEEVGAWLSAWWNIGCPWFSPAWAAEAHEWAAVSSLLVPYFDQWFPKGTGDSALIPLFLAALGTGITMVVKRADLIKQYGRRPWVVEQIERLKQQQQAQQQTAAPQQSAAGPTPPAPNGRPAEASQSAPAAGPGYRLPRELVRTAEPRPPGQPYPPGML